MTAIAPTLLNVPKFLFRYLRDDDHLLETLETPYLWFSAPDSLNDPFDFANVFEFRGTPDEIFSYIKRSFNKVHPSLVDEAELKHAINTNERLVLEKAANVATTIHREYLKKIGLCCFSFVNDAPLMWAHYSGGHSGICLVIQVTSKLLEEYSIIEVQYHLELPKWNLLVNRLRYGESFLYNKHFDQTVLGSKFSDWAYEREYRLIAHKRGKHPIDPSAITGTVFGARMKQSRKEEIATAIKSRFPHVKVVDAVLDVASGSVCVGEFKNSLLKVPISAWRMLDDGPGAYRDFPAGKAVSRFKRAPGKSIELTPSSTWNFSYRLTSFEPSFVNPARVGLDHDFDATIMREFNQSHRWDEPCLSPKPGSGVESAISPVDHVAAIINLTLATLTEEERNRIEVGPEYVFSWSGEPGYQFGCSLGVFDIIAVAARVKFSSFSCEKMDVKHTIRDGEIKVAPSNETGKADVELQGPEITVMEIVAPWSREGAVTKPLRTLPE